ncbi:MAG: hypothetical protein IH863_01520, partial [Chloroflexi bacterium]|nr:hypothetical protein [Chloroflexota bacterium]
LMALTLPGSPEPAVFALPDAHRAYLIRIARRTLRHAVLGRDLYEPDYIPASLASLSAEVVVRLRQRGYLLAVGTAGPKPIALAARDASFAAARQLTGDAAADIDLLSRLLVEVEIISPAEPIPAGANWTEPRAVDPFIEPGVHGMVLTGPRGRQRFCPSELITSDLVLAAALDRLAKRTHGSASQLAQVQLERFRTLHFYQGPGGDKIVSLHRGMTLVPPQAVSPAGLMAAIEKLAGYMVYRQKRSGLFTYQYEPARDAYSDEDNLVRQMGATLAMAVHARWSEVGGAWKIVDADISARG